MKKYIQQNEAIFLFLISFTIVFAIQYKMVTNTLPYSVHVDEAPIVSKAIRMMKTGDFNPHSFNYPTLPIYLTTIGTTIGFFKSASQLETKSLKDLSGRIYPYFKYPTIIKYPKLLFIMLSSLIFVFLALIIKNIYPNQKWIYCTIPILFASNVYMKQSWSYLNVNIIGAFFIISTLLYLLVNKGNDSIFTKVLFPSILVGATIASKYNFFPLVIPVMLSIFFYSKEQKIFKILLILPVSIVTFIVLVPYSLLDFPKFLTDVSFEIWHYKSGHLGYDGTPGFQQLLYYLNSIFMQFTIPLTLVDRKSTRLNSSHTDISRMPSSA